MQKKIIKVRDQIAQDHPRLDKKTAGKIAFAIFLKDVSSKLNLQKHKLDSYLNTHNIGRPWTDFQTNIDLGLLKEDLSVFESIYKALIEPSDRKAQGQFFTPPPIADFMAGFIPNYATDILDPAVGTGIFPEYIIKKRGDNNPVNLVCFDTDPLLLESSNIRLQMIKRSTDNISLIEDNFLKAEKLKPERKFDVVICNPPYKSFQNYELSLISKFQKKFKLSLTKLSNIYVLFFLAGNQYLKPEGKLIFITPSEFISTAFGKELKKFFLRDQKLESIFRFDPKIDVFQGPLTTAAITVLSKKKERKTASFINIKRDKDLNNLNKASSNLGDNYRKVDYCKLNHEENWLKYFTRIENRHLLSATIPLKEIADVKRGIATGYNDFFALSSNEIKHWGIEDRFLKKVLVNTRQAPNYIFSRNDFDELNKKGEKIFLLYCQEKPSNNLENYLEFGEKELEAHKRYLTSNRNPWFSPEKRKIAPIMATVFSRDNMRFVFNKAGVLNLSAFHCVYPKISKKRIKSLLAYLNSNICLELSKLKKRSYGGGLNKFEPGDLKEIPVLDIGSISTKNNLKLSALFDRLDQQNRDEDDSVEKVRELIDKVLLEIMECRLGE